MRAVLRRTLAVWTRCPREMALANGAFILAVVLPLLLLRGLPEALRLAGLLAWALEGWMAFSALTAACLAIHDAAGAPWAALRAWWSRQWVERLAAFACGAVGLAWGVGVTAFWARAPLSPWLSWPLLAVCGGLGLWSALGLLMSVGVAAEGGRPWREQWRMAALLPLAYLPQALALALGFVALSGAPVLLVGLRHWSAPLLLAPLILSTVFTAATAALFLGLLVRSLLAQARGEAPEAAPAWRELWRSWR
jgi:hypothetical protein